MAAAANTIALRAAGLTIAVAGRAVVERADLAIGRGECWALLGPNGVGKTLLLHTLAGLRAPQAGTIEADGRALSAWQRRSLAQRLGLLLQDEVGDYWGTVREYVTLGRLPHRPPFAPLQESDTASVDAGLVSLGLDALAPQAYRTLSGGERQRVRLAQLIAQNPDVFLLDEPLNHLDLAQQITAMRCIAALARAGHAVVCTIHDPALALRYCSHALLMYDSGRLEQGPVADVVSHPALEALYKCRLEGADTGPAYGPLPR
jgi:iron complex transport system ATP-binding protein